MNLNIAKEWFERHAALEGDHEIGAGRSHACNCIGPQKGAPLCPCMMQSVTIEAGRYVERRDLGPATKESRS
jgi:hypothetical protein